MDTEPFLEECRSRQGVYVLLAGVFGREPDVPFLERLESSGLRSEMEGRDLDLGVPEGAPLGGVREILAQEYTRIFIGPGPHVPLFGSVHSEREGDRGRLWGDSTVEVKKFIESTGLRFRPDYGGIPDHLAVELEFMARLVEAEGEAATTGDQAAVQKLRDAQRRFLSEHMLPWVGTFLGKVSGTKPHPFYASLTKFCHDWLVSEMAVLQAQA